MPQLLQTGAQRLKARESMFKIAYTASLGHAMRSVFYWLSRHKKPDGDIKSMWLQYS